MNFFHLADILSVSAALALVFIKIGQILSGAGFGSQTDLFPKIKIADRPGFYHPVELYESVIYLILFVELFFLYKKGIKNKWISGLIFSLFTFFATLTTILLEYIKVYRVYFYGFSFRQILGLIILVSISIFFLVRTKLLEKLLNYFKKNKNEIS